MTNEGFVEGETSRTKTTWKDIGLSSIFQDPLIFFLTREEEIREDENAINGNKQCERFTYMDFRVCMEVQGPSCIIRLSYGGAWG